MPYPNAKPQTTERWQWALVGMAAVCAGCDEPIPTPDGGLQFREVGVADVRPDIPSEESGLTPANLRRADDASAGNVEGMADRDTEGEF